MTNSALPETSAVTGIILAGGQGLRMQGSDKGLLEYQGMPLIEHVLAALKPQVSQILISANRNVAAYQRYGFPVLSDPMGGYQGPLAGIAAALAKTRTPWLLTAPCDGPFVPADLCQRLLSAALDQGGEVAIVHDGQRLQPLYALIQTALLPKLTAFLDAGDRKTLLWLERQRMVTVDYSDAPEHFRNFNRPSDFSHP